MIQDIAPHRFDNRYIPDKQPAPGAAGLVFCGDEVLVNPASGEAFAGQLPTVKDVTALFPKEQLPAFTYLFSIDETDYFLYPLTKEKRNALSQLLPSGGAFSFLDTGSIRRKQIFAQHLAFAVLTAHHLYLWYMENRYCGSCAQETVHAPDERALECPSCHRRIYPKIMPAVIVAVTDGDQIVLTRYANRPIAYHALVAGFNEIGETLEDTVRREVMEEVGLRVKNIRYYKSQPWAIAGDILAGFFCDVDGDRTIRMDDTELKEAEWVRRCDVDGQPDNFSLTNEMMMVFKDGKEPR